MPNQIKYYYGITINLLKVFTKPEVEDYEGNLYWLQQYYYAWNEYLQHEEDKQQQEEEGVKKDDDCLNVQQMNSDHTIPQASFSMSQQIPEIDKEEEEEEEGKNSSTTFETVEKSSLSSLSANQQQQELLNNQNGSAKVEEDDNRYTSSRSTVAEDGEGAKNQDSLNMQQNNHNGIPQGSFSMPQQIPEIGKGKSLLIFETGESSSSNQQQEVLSNQIRSAEAGVRGDQLVDKLMNVEPDINLIKVKKVNELRPGTNGFSITVKLVDCKIIKNATSRRAECLVGDETAMVVLTAKKKNVDLFTNLKPGTTIILHNAKVELFKGSMRLLVDEPNGGRIEINTRPASFSVKEDNNMSLIEWEKLVVN
ncbi:hypothetical protein AQUCO_00700049v1 [Aquilegia coerulea]|uniref:Single-stranded DNA binding protein Ssb-like OB fold domain-containing protein n=1 Tax=Aquilegia coerulea TaxID=218851 RepID=A0A2G5EI93_AQUCA|nr:hypothetical protein AQUCO_00700049v1 [Aquilegia coerulea]